VEGRREGVVRRHSSAMGRCDGRLGVAVRAHLHQLGIVVVEVFAGEEPSAFTWAFVGTALDGGESLALA
jgi:hypothetical protein